MRKVLLGCSIANIAYSFFEFTSVITPAYIIVLLLLTILSESEDKELARYLSIVTAAIVILLSFVVGFNLVIILTSIVIFAKVTKDELDLLKQNKSIINKITNVAEDKKKILINTKFDKGRIKEVFDNYMLEYDKTNKMIDKNYNHSINVADSCIEIAKSIKLDEEGQFLAYVIGMIYKIGIFDQIKFHNTDKDIEKLDYSDYGYRILKEGLLRQFIQENIYDKIILEVVKNYNKEELSNKISEDVTIYYTIVKDADKLNVLKTLSDGIYKDDFTVNKDMVITENLIKELDKKKDISIKLVNNELDKVIVTLSSVYDMTYKYTLNQIKENDYLNKYLLLLDTYDSVKLQLKSIVDNINKDIDKKIKKAI